MPTKDGKWRIASLALVAGIGALSAACGLALSPRRKRRIPIDITEAGTPIQQLTRYRAADGTHSIHATLRAEFAPGDRSTTLHVAFCPPFERLPSVEAEAVDDSNATVKLTQILHNGVQIDVRISESSDENQSVTVAMIASDAIDLEPS